MNRRLLKSTYYVEEQDIYFTNGIPQGWDASATQSSSFGTFDYRDPLGSHLLLRPRGGLGEFAQIQGPAISPGSKIVELEFERVNVSAIGVQVIAGFRSNDGNSFSSLNMWQQGGANLTNQNDDNRSRVDIYSGLVNIQNVDFGITIDFEQKETTAHIEHDFVKISENFPEGKVLFPTLRASLTGDYTPNVRVWKVKLNIYS